MLAGGGNGGGVFPNHRHTKVMHTTSLQPLHQHHHHSHRPPNLHQQQNLHFGDVPSGAEHAAIIVHRAPLAPLAPLAPHDDDDVDATVGLYNAPKRDTFDGGAAYATTAHHPPTHHHTQHSHCLIHSRCPHHSYQRHRCISVSSQATLLSNLGNGIGGGSNHPTQERLRNEALSASQLRLDQTPTPVVPHTATTNYNGIVSNSSRRSSSSAISRLPVTDGTAAAAINGKTMTNNGSNGGGSVTVRIGADAPKSSTLGSIAEKLRRGTRKVLLFTSSTTSAMANGTDPSAGGNNVADAATCEPQPPPPTMQKHNSIDSGGTNTISNSSLQEVDAEEFDSAELARHMGEINNEINAMTYCAVPGNVPTAAGDDV